MGMGAIKQSLLGFRDFPSLAADPAATVITLHGRGGHLDQLVPLCSSLQISVEISAPEAPREVHSYTSAYTPEDLGSYWFNILYGGVPDPTRFGDSLWRLEQFVLDVVRRGRAPDRPVILVGYEQGASLALTLAGVVPEYIGGVAGICGYIPRFRDWSMPVHDLGGLPVLIINDPNDDSIGSEWITNTVDDLRERGASLTTEMVPGAKADVMNAAGSLSEWFRARVVGSAT